jgi:hypothetical protein
MLPPGTRLTAAALARTLVRGPERALAEDSPSVAVEALIRIFALED